MWQQACFNKPAVSPRYISLCNEDSAGTAYYTHWWKCVMVCKFRFKKMQTILNNIILGYY